MGQGISYLNYLHYSHKWLGLTLGTGPRNPWQFGNATGLFLFMSPVVTFKRIVTKRSTEQFSGIPCHDLTQLLTLNLNMLKSATRNFEPGMVLGVGGFGTVYRGWVDEKTLEP